VRMPRPTPLWLLLCPLWLTGCIGDRDSAPVPQRPATARAVPPNAAGPAQVVGHDKGPNPADNAASQGGFLLPSKYMLMAPPSGGSPNRPPHVRTVPVPQGVPFVQEARPPAKD
jgi:hypothetical protein